MRALFSILFALCALGSFGQSKSTHYSSNVSGLTTHGDHGNSVSYKHKIVNVWTEAHEQKSTNYSNRTTIGVIRTTTSVPEILPLKSEPSLSIYPNPVGSELTIKLEGGSTVQTVEVLDLKGTSMILEKGESGHAVLDMSSLAKGIYLVRVQVDGYFATKRIMKM